MNLETTITLKWNVDLHELSEEQRTELRMAALDRANEQVSEGMREGELLHILSDSGEDGDTLSGWWTCQEADNVIAAMSHNIESLKALVDRHIVNKGDTCETSQQMCLLNAIAHLEQTINGIERSDIAGEF